MILYRLKYRISPGFSARYAVVNLETFTAAYRADDGLTLCSSSIDLRVIFGQHGFLIDRETWNDLKANLAPLARQNLNRLNPRNEETVPDPTLPSEADETPHPFALADQNQTTPIRVAEAYHLDTVPLSVPAPSPSSGGAGASAANGDEAEDRCGIQHPSSFFDWALAESTSGGPG